MSENSIPKVTYEIFFADGPPDVEFLVYRVWLVEQMNAPFELSLDITTESAVDVRKLLGATLELVISRDEHSRSVYGVVAQAELIGSSHEEGESGNAGQLVIRIVVAPAAALLRQGTASRIFQDQSVQEVIEAVLTPALNSYGRKFDPGQPKRGQDKRDYCVQYHESDFDFAVRLLEEEGISYYFKHDTEKMIDVMTFVYENDEYGNVANVDGSRVFPLSGAGGGVTDLESIHHFTWKAALVTTAVDRLDYDIMEPFKPIIEKSSEDEALDEKKRKRRLYFAMGRRYVQNDVKQRMQDHLEVARLGGEVFSGESNAIDFRAGALFEVEGDTAEGLDRTFLLTRVVHTGYAAEALHFNQGGDDEFSDDLPRYSNRFECIPSTVPLRPAQLTPKPRIKGVQTGIVVGPSSEEIHTDELGRIMVQFHWEEAATYNEESSCWIRVAQAWAGPQWGALFVPRIGMEVVVSFLEGNPDRPLVTGCVYNGKSAPPYTLPDEKTKSTIKSQSSPGGKGFNEFRFEDAAGKEEVFLHAQKDHNEIVKNNMSTSVGNDQSLSVGNNRTKSIKGNEVITINKDRKSTIDGSDSINVKGSYNIVIDGGACKGDAEDPADLGAGVTITGQYNIGVSDKVVIGVGGVCPASASPSKLIMDPSTILFETTDKMTLKVGASEIILTPGKIELKSPHILAAASSGTKLDMAADADLFSPGTTKMEGSGAKITLNASTAEVTGTQIGLLAGPSQVLADPSGVEVSGPKVDVKGTALVAVSGAMVKLN